MFYTCYTYIIVTHTSLTFILMPRNNTTNNLVWSKKHTVQRFRHNKYAHKLFCKAYNIIQIKTCSIAHSCYLTEGKSLRGRSVKCIVKIKTANTRVISWQLNLYAKIRFCGITWKTCTQLQINARSKCLNIVIDCIKVALRYISNFDAQSQ